MSLGHDVLYLSYVIGLTCLYFIINFVSKMIGYIHLSFYSGHFSIMGSRVLLVSHNFTSSVSSSCMFWWSFHKFVSSLELIEFTKKAIWTWDGLYVSKFILSYKCGTFQIFCLSLCHCGEVQYSLSIRACPCLKSCTLRDHISSSSSSFTHLSSRICLI